MIPKMEWQDELSDTHRSTVFSGLLLMTAAVAGVIVAALALVALTNDGRWFALPFGYAAVMLLHASFVCGSLKREVPMACAAFLLGVVALNISGVL